MTTSRGRDRAWTLVLVVGLVVPGLAVALGVFIQYQSHDLRPPEDVPRALAIPALYETMGLLAVIGALQRRPAIGWLRWMSTGRGLRMSSAAGLTCGPAHAIMR